MEQKGKTMRLIDADALKEYIDAQKGRPFIGCTIGEALKIMTDEQPTIDAVPVIRCKECKYGKEDDDGTIECIFWDFMDHTHHNVPEGFCYRAERREETS